MFIFKKVNKNNKKSFLQLYKKDNIKAMNNRSKIMSNLFNKERKKKKIFFYYNSSSFSSSSKDGGFIENLLKKIKYFL